MSKFTKKYAKIIPGVSLLVIHLLLWWLFSTGSTSGALMKIARPGWQVVGVILIMSNILFAFLFPVDAPEIKTNSINAPVVIGLIFLALTFVFGWLCILDPGSPYAFKVG